MKKLTIELENCYGIRRLKTEIDFSEKRVCAIYAPNGAMKTSFAKTFKDMSEGKPPIDLVYTDVTSVRNVKDENGNDIPKESVFVILPFDKTYKSQKISRLLANQKIKQRYTEIYETIGMKSDALVKKLAINSGLKKEDIPATLADDVTHDKKLFLVSLVQLHPRVLGEKDANFGDIVYKKVFTERTNPLLDSPEFKAKLSEYIERYDNLLTTSTFFKKGIFNHTNATTISKNLKTNKFFKASHSVFINTKNGRKEVKTEKELEDAIQGEMDTILGDEKLAAAWKQIDDKLTTEELREFREYLTNNKAIIPELEIAPRFKQKLWVSYLAQNLTEYDEFLMTYEESKKELNAIIEEAKNDKTRWDAVINKYNERFSVPFRVEVDNQTDVILRLEAPSFKYVYTRESDRPSVPIGESQLWDSILSNGETRAMYLLNVIYEIKARAHDNQETLFIIDDISDSFDYKNKYAIIEYLMETSKVPNFYQIILTHNFDFFRTIESRYVGYKQCRMAYRLDKEVILKQAEAIRNPFVRDWKPHFFTSPIKRIASIPFLRNIIEFTKEDDDPDYIKLTSLLHWKKDTADITEGDLAGIYNRVFSPNGTPPDPKKKVVDLLETEIKTCLIAPEGGVHLENKIALSIAIRLKAEQFMINKIADDTAVSGITDKQTTGLFELFKARFPNETKAQDSLEKVILMTPENIHLNSFMYEPILDMSDDHLKKLYVEISALT